MDPPVALNLCPLCPVGQMSSTPDFVLDPTANITCGSIETELLPFFNQTQCDDNAGTLVLAAGACACESPVPTCPDGAPLKQPDLPIDLTWWGSLEAETMLCRELDAGLFAEDSQEEYNNYLIYCGCVGSVDTPDKDELECPGVCDNGDPLDPAFYDTFINEEWGTCGFLALNAAWYAVDDEDRDFQLDCAGFTYYGNKLCGCTPKEEEYCELCEDGSLMNPEVGSEFDCTLLAGYAYAIPADDLFCPYYQGVGAYCGCSNPIAEEGVCRLCGDDKLIPDFFNAVEKSYNGVEGAGYPCTEYETTDEIYEEYWGYSLSCADRRKRVGGDCCPATMAPSSAPSDVDSMAPTNAPSVAPTNAPPTSSAFQVCRPKKSLLIAISVAIGSFMFGM